MTGGTAAYEHWEPHDHQAALRNQITRTRADLGDTITELAARTDVKARTREAVAQARTRAREMVRTKAQFATMRTADVARSGASRTADVARSGASRTADLARSGASSARSALRWVARSPALVAIGGGVGALAGLGIYALVRRRLPMGIRLPFMRKGMPSRPMRPGRGRQTAAKGARRVVTRGARRAVTRGARRAVTHGARQAMAKGRQR